MIYVPDLIPCGEMDKGKPKKARGTQVQDRFDINDPAIWFAALQGNGELFEALLRQHGWTDLFLAAIRGDVRDVSYLLSHGVDVNTTDQKGQTALFAATIGGNVEVVQILLSHGADVNASDQRGWTALLAAAEMGNAEVVQALLRRGVDVNASDQRGRTALFAAAEMGNVEVVQILLSHGVDVNASDQRGRTALFAAAFGGNAEVFQALLSHGVDVNATDHRGHTALFLAAEHADIEVVVTLLSHGVDVNVTALCGKTALFCAAMNRNAQIVKAVLRHDVDVNATDREGRTALFAAVKQGNVKVVEALLVHGVDVNTSSPLCGCSALFAAAEQGNVEVVQALLSHGVDVNVTNQVGHSALFAAASEGNVEVVQTLLSHGVEENVTDQEGHTALFAAAKQGNVGVVQALLSHGVDTGISNQHGYTALFAAVRGNIEVVCALLSHGVDVNATEQLGHTALFAAAEQGNVEVVRTLLSYGADVNVTAQCGHTALFVAVMKGDVEVVQALLSNGADMNATDQQGETIIFAAAGLGNIQVVQALLSHGVDLNVTDQHGGTVLFVAALSGNVQVVEALLSHGVDVKATNQRGQTALFAAAFKGNVQIVQTLLSHGVDVNATDQEGQTALFTAVFSGNVQVVQALLSHGMDVKVTNQHGQTALFCAVTSGKVEIVNTLMKHGASGSVVDKAGNTAIFYTANLMNRVPNYAVLQMIKLLMNLQVSPHTKNNVGENLLLHCLSYAREIKEEMGEESVHSLIMVCQFLIECKSDVNVRTLSSHSVIHLLLLVLRDILQQELKPLMLAQEITGRALKLICSVLSCCSKTLAGSKDDTDGNTPLHLWASLHCPPTEKSTINSTPTTNNSASQSHLESFLSEMATQLLSHGAKVKVANGNGETPLHMAQTWNAAKLLLDKGAQPNATDLDGNTPLLKRVKKAVHHHLTSAPHAPLCEVYDNMKAETLKMHWEEILNYGMDPWKANDEGTTILSSLLQADAFRLIQAFLEATQAPYGQKYPVDSNGDTPLHVICRDSGEANFWKLNLIDDLVRSEASSVNCSNRKGETPLHIVCQRKSFGSLTCDTIQHLRKYGAKVDIPDAEGKTCLDIALAKPELTQLLTQSIDLSEIKPWLPWSSKSERHKIQLAEVARGQNACQTGSFRYHTKPIGSGAFGSVFAGLNSEDGLEVAVKRIEKVRVHRDEDKREVESLIHLKDCERVVRYFSYCDDTNFSYIVLELMEGNLEELLSTDGQVKNEEVSLCRQMLDGLQFLHQNDVIHRDIKPGNILYKCIPKLSLKLADFGLSGRIASSSVQTTTVMHSKAGTRCWMAPELLRKTAKHSEASDMFACGLVLHYLLSGKKHPFWPEVEIGKSALILQNETEASILNNKVTVDGNLTCEASSLVKQLLDCNKDDRPSATEALRHPLFWSDQKKVAFLKAVGNQPEVSQPRKFAYPLAPVEQDLEDAFSPQFATNPWDGEIPQLYFEMNLPRNRRTCVTDSAVDLLRFVRNTYSHLSDLTSTVRTSVLEDSLFFAKFPTLVMDLYKTVRTNGWDKREEIAFALKQA